MMVPIPLLVHWMVGGGGAVCATATAICPKKYKATKSKNHLKYTSDFWCLVMLFSP